MAIRGERFELNLDSDDDNLQFDPNEDAIPSFPSAAFPKDIVEREESTLRTPASPRLKNSSTGFPEHKKRSNISRFKSRQTNTRNDARKVADVAKQGPDSKTKQQEAETSSHSHETSEKEEIDRENRERLSQMSDEEIQNARQELISGLSPSLIERLLNRASIDGGDNHTTDACNDTTHDDEQFNSTSAAVPGESKSPPKKKVTFDETKNNAAKPVRRRDPEAAPDEPPPDLQPASVQAAPPAVPNVHFPKPSSAYPDLDPSSPSFLSDLHSKYFPDLAVDPRQLAWMAPLPTESSPADLSSSYSPEQEALPPSSLRFDFRGNLIPPRLARQIPTTAGLHHHGQAPEAAGYTIPELSILARSAVPAQRCIAYQSVGRILFRLGIGTFGSEEGVGEELYKGLWRCLEEGRVLDVIMAEAAKDEGTGHATARALALEAVWLWRKGGGKRVSAT